MSRRNRRGVIRKQNKGNHQRRRTTRGHRTISKFEKYKWYGGSCPGDTRLDPAIWDTLSAQS